MLNHLIYLFIVVTWIGLDGIMNIQKICKLSTIFFLFFFL